MHDKQKHVVSIVLNGVSGDSRVIKTAQAALQAGHRATIVGLSDGPKVERKKIEGVPVVLVANHTKRLLRNGLWGGQRRDIRIYVGAFIESAMPEIVSLQPDLIHSHDMLGLKVGAATVHACRAAGRSVPWVHDIHEFVAGIRGDLQEQFIPFLVEWEQEFLSQADHLITVSDALAEEISSRYGVAEPTITYNAPVLSNFTEAGPDIRTASGLDDQVPLVVFVGNASELRGGATIIDAIAKLPHVHLAMLSGSGPYLDGLTLQAKNAGMQNRLHIHPYVPSDQVTTFIRTGDLGIHALVHYPNGEVALPNKLFECLQAGLPMVTSDVASMQAFVETHGVGVSFRASDSASCAEAIQRLLSSRDRFRNAITAELKRRYSWEEQQNKIQDIYSGLLARPHVAPTTVEKARAAKWLDEDRTASEEIEAEFLATLRHSSLLPPVMHSYLYKAKALTGIVRKSGGKAAFKTIKNVVKRRLRSG